MYPGWLPEGALPVLGMRGRLGSEHGLQEEGVVNELTLTATGE